MGTSREKDQSSALARQDTGLFKEPNVRDALCAATGLTDDALDKIANGLQSLGVGLILPNGIDTQAKYANAISLVRDHGYSAYRAAKELGISATHLQRRLNAIGTNGDLEKQAAAGDRRILEMSQAMSMQAGELLLDRMEAEGEQMKTTELQKIYTAATNQVSAKQRWAKDPAPVDHGGGMAFIAQIMQGATVEDSDPADRAVDVSPSREPST